MKDTHILQYKTEGVGNIFAPTILINGVRHVNPSNSFHHNNANYPSTMTITRQRDNMAQENARQINYDNEFENIMGNMYSNENLGNELSNNLMRTVGEPLGHDNQEKHGTFAPIRNFKPAK